jgi:DNA-binding NtrC family response regulator
MEKNRILIVEDDIDILLELQRNLEDEGYEVDTADNGKTAFNLWEKNIYDLVLADLRIPEIDGRELIDKIKAKQPHTQIIILSGQAIEEDLIDAINKHIFKYLKKPVDLEEVLRVTAEALRERDPVVISLEQLAQKSPDKPILLVGKKSYTPRRLYDEVRKGTAVGKQYHEEFLKSLTDFEPPGKPVDELLNIKGVTG